MLLLYLALAVLLGLWVPGSQAAFKFLSIGDWGDDTTIVGSGLAKFFNDEAEGVPLALMLGDNFYEAGVKCKSH